MASYPSESQATGSYRAETEMHGGGFTAGAAKGAIGNPQGYKLNKGVKVTVFINQSAAGVINIAQVWQAVRVQQPLFDNSLATNRDILIWVDMIESYALGDAALTVLNVNTNPLQHVAALGSGGAVPSGFNSSAYWGYQHIDFGVAGAAAPRCVYHRPDDLLRAMPFVVGTTTTPGNAIAVCSGGSESPNGTGIPTLYKFQITFKINIPVGITPTPLHIPFVYEAEAFAEPTIDKVYVRRSQRLAEAKKKADIAHVKDLMLPVLDQTQ